MDDLNGQPVQVMHQGEASEAGDHPHIRALACAARSTVTIRRFR